MSTNRPFMGKDGGRYRDYYEKQAADKRYEQRERLIEEQKKANKLMEEQNQRIRNGGQTDSEVLVDNIFTLIILGIVKGFRKGANIFDLLFSLSFVGIIIAFIAGIVNVDNLFDPMMNVIKILVVLLIISFVASIIYRNSKNSKTVERTQDNSQQTNYEDEIKINFNTISNIKDKYEKGNMDEDLIRAIDIVVEEQQASTSFIQRKLGIGYVQAREITQQIEDMKIISPMEGRTPRKVLLSKEKWEQIKKDKNE